MKPAVGVCQQTTGQTDTFDGARRDALPTTRRIMKPPNELTRHSPHRNEDHR